MTGPIYLDHNASTPAAPEVVEELARVLREVPGNALSVHAYGRAAREVVERALARVASLLSARADEIVFTSGGTESNNAAVYGVAKALASRGRHIVTTVIEHASIERPCRVLESRGFEAGYALAALLLLGSRFADWLPLAFPLWVLVLSLYILIENLRGKKPGAAA